MAAPVFISYSSKDSKVARTICSSLESRGLSCWIASRDVGPGENFMEAIVRAIHAAKVMVLVFSENAHNSDEIKRELVLAGNAKVTVIPVRVEDVAPRDSFAYQLATRQWIDLFEDWESQVERLSTWIAGSLKVTAPDEVRRSEREAGAAVDAGKELREPDAVATHAAATPSIITENSPPSASPNSVAIDALLPADRSDSSRALRLSDRIAGSLLIILACGVIAWFRVYAAGLSWTPSVTVAIIVGTIVSGVAMLLTPRRQAIFIALLIGIPVSVLTLSPWAGRVEELFNFNAFTYRTSLTTAWMLVLCYVPALAFFVWRAWQLPRQLGERRASACAPQ